MTAGEKPMVSLQGPLLVTGGTGFIGTHLVARLLAVQTGVVRVFARSTTPFAEPEQRVELFTGDLRDEHAVHDAVRGVRLVFHLAACARAWVRDPREFFDVNVAGTRHLLRAVAQVGVERLVHVSTALVAAPPEAPPQAVRMTAYQRSKLEAEQVIDEFLQRGMDVVVARPTRVFGPGPLNQANSVTRMVDLYLRGLFRVRIADGDALANYVSVEDVADGLLRVAQLGRTGACYALGGQDATLTQFLDMVARSAGVRRTVFALPRKPARLISQLSTLAARIAGEPIITPEWVDLLSLSWPVSSEHARHDCGYQPRGLEERVAETVTWLRAGRPAPAHTSNPRWQSA